MLRLRLTGRSARASLTSPYEVVRIDDQAPAIRRSSVGWSYSDAAAGLATSTT